MFSHRHSPRTKKRAKKVMPLSVDLPIAKGPWHTGHGPCLASLSPWRQPVFVALHPKRIPAKGTREDWGKRSSDAGWTEAGVADGSTVIIREGNSEETADTGSHHGSWSVDRGERSQSRRGRYH
ncbi:hypothetical protein CDEST_07293 [Colletotrichum destructivum]|uniref:Uncharacterized protein n=1 Tax=Colletotrichum destructivum TaxID=34406 RepID=A0AAX4IG05_9PEZI|nr:hypothetical protein CDEST_07293 [Colletotrichum destructivum]